MLLLMYYDDISLNKQEQLLQIETHLKGNIVLNKKKNFFYQQHNELNNVHSFHKIHVIIHLFDQNAIIKIEK
jgi:hypothetical protein